jgi:hypothetical protein
MKLYKCDFFRKNGYTDNIIVRYIHPAEKEGYFRMRVMKQNAETKEFCDSQIVEVTQEFIDDYLIPLNTQHNNDISKTQMRGV